jgi:hypothetical protein
MIGVKRPTKFPAQHAAVRTRSPGRPLLPFSDCCACWSPVAPVEEAIAIESESAVSTEE